MKNLKMIFIFIMLLIGTIFTFASLNAGQTNLPDFSNNGMTTYSDSELGFSITIPMDMEINKVNEKTLKNVVYIRNKKENIQNLFGLKIVAFEQSDDLSPLYLLETYILNNVGIISKNNQKVFKSGDYEVAQIGYNPFKDDDLNYFSIYTLVKHKDRSWIIAAGYYDDMHIKNSLNMTTKFGEIYNKYLLPSIHKNQIYLN